MNQPLVSPSTRRKFLHQSVATVGALSAPSVFARDTIRIGYVSPRTGPFAPFAEADEYILQGVRKALANGLRIGGKTYAVEIVARDDQSREDRASNLAGELINKHGVDLMLSQGALTVVGVSQQCELAGVPSVSTMTPWQAWMFPLKSDPGKGFKHAFHFFWGIEDIGNVYTDIWSDLRTNKKVGMVWSNDVPGNAFGDPKLGLPAQFAAAGYSTVEVGRFPVGADDFSTHIQAFKRDGVEIVTGLFNPPEWATFVRQSAQMGFKPKVATVAKALLFPGGVAALGASAEGMSTEIWWTPRYPFTSSLTQQTAAQLAEGYTSATRRDWTQPIGVVHALFETGIAALRASGDPKNPEKVSEALRTLKLQTVIGQLDFANSGIKNVSKMRVVGGQWSVGQGGKPEIFITHNKTAPEIPVQRAFNLLKG
ncbi:MAG: ABC transporter substrate-binding protein [Hydrogenophaga sp.]|uniref:ABC transporter substrate-binding protein n=1 Tax=Hydrogenophaga sp. TaxID=1904254 RepID=UPI002AB8C415|nr:ABC transporter substrate-binding protein [Hydrogenophaga sp.]MDZ4279409.1 ABC transporter substrate-binding protein [Hydrogenophaga sp.]